jgi:hypothetical protein
MLVHICCSVDSAYYLRKLREVYPQKELTGFFYDPNIHPYGEYYLRMIDARRSCERLGVSFIEGEYNVAGWLEAIRGFEAEPEKGKRCTLCFDDRLEASAKKAVELGINEVTTTLLMSPKKDFSTLEKVARSLEKRYGVQFVSPDFRKGGGTQAQFLLSKTEQNYHQNYCGCLFALNDQRTQQGRVAAELFSPIGQEVLPGSIEERIALYEARMELEAKGIAYRIIREKGTVSRLLRGVVKQEGATRPAFFLPGAKISRKLEKVRLEFVCEGVAYLNKEGIRLMELAHFNRLAGRAYRSVTELIFSPPPYEIQQKVKAGIAKTPETFSPIIVLDRIEGERWDVVLESLFYEDTREFLVILG